ncbi:hypothetical protein [uncultured Jatrophihabitans sp.]|uniref:hypothetical protein n=1 Tax=uncultured Jatrophihabitans sp. TaxID=1610747 RepID=UPI0035CB8903
MRRRVRHWVRATALSTVALVCLSGCASALSGEPSAENAANATLNVVGVDKSSSFDQTVQNALSDVEAFWKTAYPTISGGKPLEPLKGGLYSVDGLQVAKTGEVSGPAGKEGCIAESPSFIIDNGAFCLVDDSIAWDRAETHLFAKLAKQYGTLMVALIFAHEFGHAISYRLGVFDRTPKLQTIYTESQADCAAGAWAASALKHQAAHFVDTTPEKLDDALEGFLDGRDSTPGTINEVSHGNGFDRLSALADGLKNGVKYCYSDSYFNRTFTERPFSSQDDYDAGGNQPLADVVDPSGLEVRDLNRFWTAAGKLISKTFKPVTLKKADHPKCGGTPTSEFGYCPTDNTVYYSASFAKAAYNSLPGVQFDQDTGDVILVFNQPADFALGELISIGWGLAVRHQFFGADMDGTKALKAAVCYTGAYAKDVNLAQTDPAAKSKILLLSPADLDEAVSALLDLAGQDRAFGARGTTGLDRIQAFNQGYKQSLSSCNY